MSTPNHTPGPWSTFGPVKCQVYGGDPIRRIAVVDYTTGSETEEHNANAYLIAAAPAMYEALKQTFNVMENILTDSQLDTRTPCGLTIREWESKVRIALAQAEGNL